MGVTRKYTLLLGALTAVAAVTASTAVAGKRRGHTYATRWTRPLHTAVFDPFSFNGSEYTSAFEMTRRAGAGYAEIVVPWQATAPTGPQPGENAADPSWSGYAWGWIDTKVEAAETAGLEPMLLIGTPPAWALGRGSTPKLTLLREFVTALALHYDGREGVPPVHIFEVWNEPNLSLDLSPVKPATYRSMVNVAADAIHAVSKKNLVVAGGLDPYKNKAKHWHSVAPLAYMRALLCLSRGRHPHRTCKAKIHFDIWSHHPYTHGGPFAHAKVKDDVSLGDLPKMDALLKAGVRLHHIVSRRHVQFWVTEFGWDSYPPRRHGVPLRLLGRWTAEALYQMWRSGVSLATWYMLEDQPNPSPYQSGLYRHAASLKHARAKPGRQAFRFPFVAYLRTPRVAVWGRDATSNKELVKIELRHGAHGHWRTVARIRSNRYGIFRASLRIAATEHDWLRAEARGSGKSLAFSLTVPKSERRYGPWGN